MTAIATTVSLVTCSLLIACSSGETLEEIRSLQAAGKMEASIEPLRELLADEQPVSAEVYYLYGRALALSGQPMLALWSLSEAMEDAKWRRPAGLQLAHTNLRGGNSLEAIEILDQLIAEEPDDMPALLLRANTYAATRMHYEEAIADAERLEELDPEGFDALKPKIKGLLGLQRGEEAEAAIEELGRRIAESEADDTIKGWHCATAAIFAEENDQPDLAAERWADCSERFPTHSNVLQNAITYYDSEKDFDRSLAILRRAFEAMPESPDARGMLATRLRAMGLLEEGEALLREGTESTSPEAAMSAWVQLADYHSEANDYDASATALGEAIELARAFGTPPPQLLLQRADALVLAGRLDEALAAGEALPLPAYRAMIRAGVAEERGQPQEALAHYDDAFLLWPNNNFARYNAALVAESIGDFDRAIAEYRYALRMGPDATDALLRLARLHNARREYALALGMLERVEHPRLQSFDETLLALHIWARVGADKQVLAVLERIRTQVPGALALAVEQVADGLAERRGHQAALHFLRSREKHPLDMLAPANWAVLRAFVRHAGEVDNDEDVEPLLEKALEGAPDSPKLHAIRGLWLEANDPPSARAAYERALELNPDDVDALTGLGRLRLGVAPEEALRLFEGCIAQKPEDVECLRGAALASISLGDTEGARERLVASLLEQPFDAPAAAELARLDLNTHSAGPATAELAERAVYFGGGPEAEALLARARKVASAPSP